MNVPSGLRAHRVSGISTASCFGAQDVFEPLGHLRSGALGLVLGKSPRPRYVAPQAVWQSAAKAYAIPPCVATNATHPERRVDTGHQDLSLPKVDGRSLNKRRGRPRRGPARATLRKSLRLPPSRPLPRPRPPCRRPTPACRSGHWSRSASGRRRCDPDRSRDPIRYRRIPGHPLRRFRNCRARSRLPRTSYRSKSARCLPQGSSTVQQVGTARACSRAALIRDVSMAFRDLGATPFSINRLRRRLESWTTAIRPSGNSTSPSCQAIPSGAASGSVIQASLGSWLTVLVHHVPSPWIHPSPGCGLRSKVCSDSIRFASVRGGYSASTTRGRSDARATARRTDAGSARRTDAGSSRSGSAARTRAA
jgi:hypothetical protein